MLSSFPKVHPAVWREKVVSLDRLDAYLEEQAEIDYQRGLKEWYKSAAIRLMPCAKHAIKEFNLKNRPLINHLQAEREYRKKYAMPFTITSAYNPPSTSGALAVGHYISSNGTPKLLHPRPSTETNSWAYQNNSYPGKKWSIPVSTRYGAFPFYNFTVSGMSGLYIDTSTSNTGHTDVPKLVCDSPVAGTYTITLSFNDQDGNVITQTWDHTCGTAGWLFLDEVNGDDTWDGTSDVYVSGTTGPMKTLNGWYKSSATDTTYSGYRVMYRQGIYPVSNFDTSINTMRLDSVDYAKPYVHVQYPGETATWDFTTTNANFQSQASDFYCDVALDNIKTQATNPNDHVSAFAFNPGTGATRLTLLSNVTNVVTKATNSIDAAYYFSQNLPVSATNVVIRGTFGGTSSSGLCCTYELTDFVIEDIAITGTLTCQEGALYIKDGNQNGSIRRVECMNGVQQNCNLGIINLPDQEARQQTNIEIQYCYLNNYSPGNAKPWALSLDYVSNTSTPARNIWIQRNTLVQDINNNYDNLLNLYLDGNVSISDSASPFPSSGTNLTVYDGSTVANVQYATTAGAITTSTGYLVAPNANIGIAGHQSV